MALTAAAHHEVLAWKWQDALRWLEAQGYRVSSVSLARAPGRKWFNCTDLRVVRLEDTGQGQLRVVVVREAAASL